MNRRERPPDPMDRAWGAFAAALVAPIAESWRLTAAAAALVAAFALLLGTAPVLFLDDMALDVFIPLDGAWRMAHGQWPHLDFATPIGALYYVLLDLAGPGPLAPVRASLVLLPFTTVAALVVTRARLPTPLRLAVVLLVAFGTMSPRTLDSLALVSHLASYNRHGWALLAIVMAGTLIEPRQREPRGAVVEVALLTLSVVAAFYLKVTLFAACFGVLVVAVLAGGGNRAVALATAASSLAILALGFAVGSTNAAYLDDLRRAAEAGAEAGPLLRVSRLVPTLLGNQAAGLALVVAIVAFLRTARGPEEEREASRVALSLLAVFAGVVLVGTQSHDRAIPCLPVLVAAAYAAWRERWARRADDPLPMQLVGALALAVVAAPVALDAGAIARHTVGAWSGGTAPLVDLPGPGSRIRIPGGAPTTSPLDRVITGELPPDAYDNLNPPWRRDDDVILRDAVRLLEARGLTRRRVASLTFSPTFPWLLGSDPPRGLPAWHDYQRTFSADATADAAERLADAEVVLVPRVWRIEGIWEAYRPAVEASFEIADRSPLWTVWVRTRPSQ